MSKATYNAKELAEILGCSPSKAYQFIRIMNDELKSKGFLVLRGRVPAVYVNERFFGMNQNTNGKAVGA